MKGVQRCTGESHRYALMEATGVLRMTLRFVQRLHKRAPAAVPTARGQRRSLLQDVAPCRSVGNLAPLDKKKSGAGHKGGRVRPHEEVSYLHANHCRLEVCKWMVRDPLQGHLRVGGIV